VVGVYVAVVPDIAAEPCAGPLAIAIDVYTPLGARAIVPLVLYVRLKLLLLTVGAAGVPTVTDTAAAALVPLGPVAENVKLSAP
jgi:hypothetical protein